MSKAIVAMQQLAVMANDEGSDRFFEHGGPLEWFTLAQTYEAAKRKETVSDKQCGLIDRVFNEYLRLRAASAWFFSEGPAKGFIDELVRVHENRPKRRAIGAATRLANLFHELLDHRVVHTKHFDKAEALVGELGLDDLAESWMLILGARLMYLERLYGVTPLGQSAGAKDQEQAQSPVAPE